MDTFWTSLRSAVVASRHPWLDEVEAHGLPTTSDEVWRYAPLRELAESTFTGGGELVSALENALVFVNGELVGRHLPAGVEVDVIVPDSFDAPTDDAFESVAHLVAPAAYVIRFTSSPSEPVIIDQQFTTAFSGCSLLVEVAPGVAGSIIERICGGVDGFISSSSRVRISDRGSLTWSTYQSLDDSAWFFARSTAELARDAVMTQNYAGVGARYDRARHDCVLREQGASNNLFTTYVGHGSQIHDLRTHQLHIAPRTTAQLVSKGAVGDSSRSIYTGLIEMEKGARRADARQSNHNLLLSNVAHADTVPNLDIRENDVTCAHASSVGPLDDVTRWYLESRGVPRAVAERLMVLGFFNEMLAEWPAQLAETVAADIARIIDNMVVFA
jgi:Fe-S cluster assembly protein SufD